MKQYYTKVGKLVILSLLFYLPFTVKGQCLCTGGITPDSLIQTAYYDSITSVSSPITFNQFNSPGFSLSCLKLSTSVLTIYSLKIQNDDTIDSVEYEFSTSRNSKFVGPGGFSTPTTNSATFHYGPFKLAPYDPVGTGDEILAGPDTVFNNIQTDTYLGVTAPYSGVGSVNFTYTTFPTITQLGGGGNRTLVERFYVRLNARLAYYFCPNSVLASNILDFTAAKKTDQVNLKWAAVNEDNTTSYIIEYSVNGKDFIEVGSIEKQLSGVYNFAYPLNSADQGNVFFRVKEIDNKGKAHYSAVRKVSLNSKAAIQITTYPNPATDAVYLSFDRLISGNYKVEMVSAAGQVVYNNQSKVSNTNTIQINWKAKPAPGIYFARVTNLADMDQQVVRIVVR